MSMSWRHVQDRSTIKDNHVARFFRFGRTPPWSSTGSNSPARTAPISFRRVADLKE